MQEPPINFEYLRIVAGKYGNFYGVPEFESFVANMTAEQLQELRTAYEAIRSRDDSFRISRWTDECFERQKEIPKLERDFARQVGQLLVLFRYLARAGTAPFSSEEVGHIEILKKPNWQNLPEELQYLIDVAEVYGIHQSESDIWEFLDNAPPNDMEVLASTAERVRLTNHSEIFYEWMKKFPLHKHPESAMIYWLFALLAHAGLEFESLI